MKRKETVIYIENLSKSFKLPKNQHKSLKKLFIHKFQGYKNYEVQRVLNNISFEVKKGEFFGIVGKNGSGKSTLLKIISGIYTPNKGSVDIKGSLVPFIELGVGFNPELTGRENIYLNGAMLGFSRKEMEHRYKSIVEFAELDKFMDQKLKNYSSGMQVRLAFSIAIQAESDILILDEVLAVGDESFQRKCFNYFHDIKASNKTVILVTHDMGSVERFCTRAMLLNNGKIEIIGSPSRVSSAYSRLNEASYIDENKVSEIKNTKKDFNIKILNDQAIESLNFRYGEKITLSLKWKTSGVKYVGLAIFGEGGEYVFGPNTYQDKYELKFKDKIDYEFIANLNSGRYFIRAALFGENDADRICFIEEGIYFDVFRDYGEPKWGGLTKLDYKWV